MDIGEWEFGLLKIVMHNRGTHWYSGRYTEGVRGEVLSTDISLGKLLDMADTLAQGLSPMHEPNNEDPASVRLISEGDTVKVSHSYDGGGYTSSIPRAVFYNEVIAAARGFLAEQDQ